ncbi:hypothetical protein COCMIDRAFT_27803 [Bipolaris oryzae ATCC 44560]|uniref:Uncharacterized protein n=1 Tax=Bipolaris oryzae ATCC 44560 TaxID=930090 RepID=W6Z218_COCMI|nr:uncharacterized protein COCMIDRAFT_27803 [Bipolaris oryzae ATCC 44560]EUC43743.1 hypothetical protein COCMIDRAFT_27803 [Bipolaris oryzae ATCC 44560]
MHISNTNKVSTHFKTCMKATSDTTTNTCNARLTPSRYCLGHLLRKTRSASKSSNNENGFYGFIHMLCDQQTQYMTRTAESVKLGGYFLRKFIVTGYFQDRGRAVARSWEGPNSLQWLGEDKSFEIMDKAIPEMEAREAVNPPLCFFVNASGTIHNTITTISRSLLTPQYTQPTASQTLLGNSSHRGISAHQTETPTNAAPIPATNFISQSHFYCTTISLAKEAKKLIFNRNQAQNRDRGVNTEKENLPSR